MPPGFPPSGVTYHQMVDYVATQVTPVEVDMDAHNVWHRDQLTIAQRADRAVRLGLASIWVAVAAIIVSIVLAVVLHH